MAQVAISIEGGLVAADLLDRITAAPREIQGQRGRDFGVEAGRLSDEIQKAFSDARAYWEAFKRRREHARDSLTTVTREAWVIPLLELLGYDLKFQRAAVQIAGTSYPISHRPGDDPEAPPVHIVAWDQELDRRGEAKCSPHAMVQDYLNRSDPLWGIVTNGRRLRLLRDTARLAKPTFVEFDLEGLFEGNLYSEFVGFYRLVHRTRLPQGAGDAHDCLLEGYYQQGIEEGGRVREHLRDGVETALQQLGTGFLAHPKSEALRAKVRDKRLDETEFYRQLLRLIYRLLFLMVAEERKLLLVEGGDAARQEVYTRWYGVSRLRQRAERPFQDDRHADLWEGLKQTFALFEKIETAGELGLSALDGELFGRLACADLLDAGLANDVLLRAVFQLSTFEEKEGRKRGVRRRVSYAGLDVEEFGSVYESLLDYHPFIALEPPRFELAAGSERKVTGSYYTPPELVRELIKSALEPVIEARLAAAATPEEKEAALLALKVCDPAAGSGHFMLAAARRLGRELAKVRSGEAEPAPGDYRQAVRDVIRHSIYAVDKNPLAVDLCKVALWIEGHARGMPLSFLDHHVKCGDSLVGVFDLAVLAEGVPDAAYKALTGDDKQVSKELKARNKAERKTPLFQFKAAEDVKDLGAKFADLARAPETRPADVQAKERAYRALQEEDTTWRRDRLACDLWTAAFFAPLAEDQAKRVPTTADVWQALSGRPGADQGPRPALAEDLAREHRFFHWPLEFPEVFAQGGFDVMLGNPPWERIKLQEQEFFAARNPEIAKAPNKAAREKLIKTLFKDDAPPEMRALGQEFLAAKHAAEAASQFTRSSGRYPLTAVGDVNTYALFSETILRMISSVGRAGFIVQSNIFTDDTTKAFFQHVMASQCLISFHDMVNLEGIFPGIHRTHPHFCLLTLSGSEGYERPDFSFYNTRTEHLGDERRRFTLSSDDIALINPNTRTCPVFRSQADAELTKAIYSRVPVLIDEAKGQEGNPWGISFMAMFHMANDSGLFRTAAQLSAASARREGANWMEAGGETWLPLYEAKMIHHYDHRWATYDDDGETSREVDEAKKSDPGVAAQPRYWLQNREVEQRLRAKNWNRGWLIGWRDITNATNERTVIAAAVPRMAYGDKFLLILPSREPQLISALLANLISIPFDYVARQKIGGTSFKYFTMKQLATIPPKAYSEPTLRFIVPRVLELTYTWPDPDWWSNAYERIVRWFWPCWAGRSVA